MHHWRALIACGLLFSCAGDLELPDGVQIQCESETECPEGLVCSTRLGRCVERGADDEPPGLSNASVTPLSNDEGTITASFDVSEELAETPVVLLGTATRPGFTVASNDGLHYSFTLPSSAGAPGAWPVLVELVDVAGNLASGLSAGNVVLDFDDPEILAAAGHVTPTSDNPLREPSAVGQRAESYVVVFNTNEPLLAAPTVNALCNGTSPELERDPTETSDTLFTYSLAASAAQSLNDTCPIVADLEDLAGNQVPDAPVSDLVMRVDRIAPSALQIDTSRLRHLRVPWGSHQTGYQAGQFLVSSALGDGEAPLSHAIDAAAFSDAGDPLALVRLWDESGAALGLVPRTPGGWAPVVLGARDSAQLLVSLVDEAGNDSSLVPVTDAEWVATLAGKVQGSLLNPLSFDELRWFEPALETPGTELDQSSGVAAVGGVTVASLGGADWLDVSVAEIPLSRHDTGMVYDAARGEALMFGGLRDVSSISRFGDTWSFDGARWIQRSPVDPEGDGNPAPRARHAMAYDPLRQEVVLFGGELSDLADHNDTWIWNGSSWRLAQAEGGAGPAPRRWARLAFDPFLGEVILFGGCRDIGPAGTPCGEGLNAGAAGDCYFDKTWAWNGASWVEVAATGPSERAAFGMATNPDEGILLYGGRKQNNGECRDNNPRTAPTDAWHWTGTAWEQVASGLPANERLGMTYSESYGGIIAALGCNNSLCYGGFGGPLAAVWQGNAWLPIRDPAVGLPLPLRADPAVVDMGRRGILLFGGFDDNGNRCTNAGGTPGSCGDTWLWKAGRWQRIHRSAMVDAPAPRRYAAATYNDADPSVLVHGGRLASDDLATNETWRFTGAGWHLVHPANAAAAPPAVEEPAMAFDASRGEILAFGGRTDSAHAPTCGTETASYYCRDTYGFSSGSWVSRSATGPTARRGTAAFYEPLNREVVIVGGDVSTAVFGSPPAASNETWAWTGAAWVNQSPLDPPPARWGAMAVADPNSSRAILFGGSQNNGGSCPTEGVPSVVGGICTLGDEFFWNGSNWAGPAEIPSPESPAPRQNAGLVFDTVRQRTLLFGGEPSGNAGSTCDGLTKACEDLWEWDGQSWNRVTVVDATGDGNPMPRAGHSFAYDRDAGQAVLIGGFDGIGNDPDGTWLFRPGTDARPAFRLAVPLAAAEIAPQELTGVEVIVRGGARGRSLEKQMRAVLAEGAVTGALAYSLATPSLAPFAGQYGQRLFRLHLRETGATAGTVSGCVTVNAGAPVCIPTVAITASRDIVLDLGVPNAAAPIASLSLALTVSYAGSNLLVELIGEAVVSGDEPGAAVQAWSLGRWKTMASGSAVPSDLGGTGTPYDLSPVNLHADLTDVPRLPVGGDDTLWLAFTPNGTNGDDQAEIVVDYVEVRARYQR